MRSIEAGMDMAKLMHQDYRELWVRAGYTATMGSAAVVPPPPSDFLRVYHICRAEYGISNIALGHLKVARFSEANDPFELLSLQLKGHTREPLRGFKGIVNNTTGMLCFSEDWKDPVMWAHYGDRHRGICLGFDLQRSLAERVIYEDMRLAKALKVVDGEAALLKPEMQKKLCLTKFSSWRYEQEQRYLVPLSATTKSGKLHFYRFDDRLRLSEVILGPECDQPLDDVRALVSKLHPKATTIASRLAFGHFAVVPKESTVP